MAWYDEAVFYHIYPLGLCGCDHENTGKEENHFKQLNQWAEHVAKLNCTAIYIGPLFESVGHGYETTDYYKVDSRLGSNEDFKKYVAHCHDLGLKVIVDGVFNHVGREFFAFKDVQEKRDQSQYCGWFCNLNFGGNNEYNDGFSYDNWGGYNLLVKLNQRNPEVQNHIFEAIRFWITEFDIDGIRLDAADVLDHDFMRAMRHSTESMKEDFWLMGEVIHGDYSRWVNDGMLHSVTDYELHKGLYSGHNEHNYFEIAHSVRRLLGICGDYRLYTFMDNHDVERIYSKLNNKDHVSLVTMLVYTLYGIPSLYYGSEFNIEGRKENGSDWNLRPYLDLKDYKDAYKNNPQTALCVALGKLKKECPELTFGGYEELSLTNRQYAYGRLLDNTGIIVALNCDDNQATMSFNCKIAPANAEDLLGNASNISYENGQLTVELPANTGTLIRIFNDDNALDKIELPKEEKKSKSDIKSEKTQSKSEAKAEQKQSEAKAEQKQSEAKAEQKQSEAGNRHSSNIFIGMRIHVENMDQMVRFYQNTFGFEAEYQQDMNRVIMKKEEASFVLYGRREFERMTCRGYHYVGGDVCGQTVLAFQATSKEDVQKLYQAAINNGGRSIWGPGNTGWSEQTSYLADPEGNVIEIYL